MSNAWPPNAFGRQTHFRETHKGVLRRQEPAAGVGAREAMSELFIEFDAPVEAPAQIESRDFLSSERVVTMRDYVAAQLGVAAHTVQLRAQHSRRGAWFPLALHQMLGEIRDCHVSSADV